MLTKKKKQILDYLKSYIKENDFAPSFEEIKKYFKLSSISTVHQHVHELTEMGYIDKNENQPRSIQINKKIKNSDLIAIPLLGTIAAGQPITIFDILKETIAVPKNKISQQKNIYALRVIGESMIEENINNGDIIIVKEQATAENGQKIVALIDNQEATLKKYFKEKDYVRLQPANKKMEPIIIRKDRDFLIQGIVLDVIKGEENLKSDLTSNKEIVFDNKIGEEYKPIIKDNKFEFYLGDCIKVIPTLNKKYSVIYLDPPFNTNRNYKYQATDNTHIFEDKWIDDEYEKWIEKIIMACKPKLKKEGSLFFHISAELSFTPEKVLRKYFKKVEPIFWKKAHGKNTVKNKLGAVVDIIFKASDNDPKFNVLYVPLDPYYFENSYKNKDEVGYYALGSIKHDKTRRGHIYTIEKDGIVYEAPYGWKLPKNKLDILIANNRIHYAKPKNGTNKGMLYKKLYKHECKGKPLSNFWDDISYITRTTKDERLYPTQKPFELLKRIIQISTDENDWVLDPVAGSGTTGAAALSLNRSATLIDINKDAVEIIKKRLKNNQQQ